MSMSILGKARCRQGRARDRIGGEVVRKGTVKTRSSTINKENTLNIEFIFVIYYLRSTDSFYF